MDADKITTQQAEIIHARIRETGRYLFRLQTRMRECGFKIDDRLFRRVIVAQITLNDLIQELHTEAFGGYGARKPK